MKKIFLCAFMFISAISLSGCSSMVVAKYDDFNETFVGTSTYDPSMKRALVDVTSTRNHTKCLGHATVYSPQVWEFKVVCNDGRNIIGSIMQLTQESTGFTNRNENITFSVVKTQKQVDEIHKRYLRDTQNKPDLDNTKKPLPANMGL